MPPRSKPEARRRSRGRKRGPGRPHDSSIDAAVLRAAHDEFVRHGFHALSMERIAARAGVSKVSLYRRWKNKAAVMGEIFRRMGREPPAGEPATFADFLRQLLRQSMGSPRARLQSRVVMRTLGEIADDPRLLALYRKHLLEPRMSQLRHVVEQARKRGELTSRAPTDAICALIAGPLFLFHLSLLVRLEVDLGDDPAEALAGLILACLR